MTISCSTLERVNLAEGLQVEFKSSIFFSAGNVRQPEIIARTIASFVNTDGGNLYLGIKDDGIISGIASDLDAMSRSLPMTTIHGPFASDDHYTYKANIDQYYLKIQKIVEAYLGKDALRFLGDIQTLTQGELVYVKVPVKKAGLGEFVRFHGCNARSSEVLVRAPGSSRTLLDKDRDDFVQRKEREKYVEGERMIETIKCLLGKQGEDLKLLLGSSQPVPSKGSPEFFDEKALRKEQLLTRIQTVLAQASLARKVPTAVKDYNVQIDLEDSMTTVMDNFLSKDGDADNYTRMVVGKYSPPFASLPYRKSQDGSCYEKIPNVDFELDEIKWIVERLTLTKEEAAVIESMERVISISRLKKNDTSQLQRFAWNEILDVASKSEFGQKVEFRFSAVYLFKANTSESWSRGGLNTMYQVTGIQFVKAKLRVCPESTQGLGYYQQDKLLRGIL